MMPLIRTAMLAVSSSLAAWIVAKATVVIALGLIATWLACQSRASVRHAMLAAIFGVLLMLPIPSILALPVRIALPSTATREPVATAYLGATRFPRVAPIRASVDAQSVTPRSSGLSPRTLLLTVWIAGMALFLAPVVIGLWQVRSLRRSALPWRQGQSLIDKSALDAGIHRRVEVLLHEALPGPITCGCVHPAILLPQDVQTWSDEDLNRAMVHELEHVRRGDWAVHCLARAVCAAYWFHPLVWMAWRRLTLEAERSCDDAVLRLSEATAYADQLVGLAQRLSRAAKSPLPAMANRADLAVRVEAVLDSRQRRGRAGRLSVALAGAAAAVLTLTISPLRIVAAPQSSMDSQPSRALKFNQQVKLIMVDVTVSDLDGKSIDGLSADDFALTENDLAQKISIFEFHKLDTASGYYILGYYTKTPWMDGKYRQIKITTSKDRMARLDYRAGYDNEPPARAGLDDAARGGAEASNHSFVTAPVLLSVITPQYSEEARKAKLQGAVALWVQISPSGRVTNMRVVRSLGSGLDEKAIEAVQKWKFSPGMKDGKAVTVEAEVEVNFQLL